MDIANDIFGDAVVVHGISMGAAATAMVSGESSSPVKNVSSRITYTSVQDQFQKRA